MRNKTNSKHEKRICVESTYAKLIYFFVKYTVTSMYMPVITNLSIHFIPFIHFKYVKY